MRENNSRLSEGKKMRYFGKHNIEHTHRVISSALSVS